MNCIQYLAIKKVTRHFIVQRIISHSSFPTFINTYLQYGRNYICKLKTKTVKLKVNKSDSMLYTGYARTIDSIQISESVKSVF